MELARAVDAHAGGRVLVFGSPPPNGRDLDLLARAGEQQAIAAALRSEGLLNRGVQWVLFRDCSAASVELVPAADWRLPQAELEDLFEQAHAVSGFRNLAVPAGAHALLIAARRVARGGCYPRGLRERVAAVLEADPSAWEQAAQRAAAWKAVRSLAALRVLHESGRQPGGVARLNALAVQAARTGSGSAAAGTRRRSRRRLTPRAARRPAVVALSGLDGAGKSLQAKRLEGTLTDLGFRVAVVWPPAANVMFQAHPAVKRLLFAVLKSLGRSAGAEPAAPEAPKPLPRQAPVVAHALALVVALVQAWAIRRGGARVAWKKDVVIYDRHALDSIVYLRQRWGHGRGFPAQSALIRRLAGTPRRAFLLDVPPEVAYARKQDFPLETLHEQARLYHALYQRLGWARLDGERPPAELCAQIAASVWASLG